MPSLLGRQTSKLSPISSAVHGVCLIQDCTAFFAQVPLMSVIHTTWRTERKKIEVNVYAHIKYGQANLIFLFDRPAYSISLFKLRRKQMSELVSPLEPTCFGKEIENTVTVQRMNSGNQAWSSWVWSWDAIFKVLLVVSRSCSWSWNLEFRSCSGPENLKSLVFVLVDLQNLSVWTWLFSARKLR